MAETNTKFLDELSEKLISWQLAFEEPIFQYINERRVKEGGLKNLPEQEQEYFNFETLTFKMEMFAAAFVIPINFFSIMYHREEKKQLTKNLSKVKFYHLGAMTTLIPCIGAFGFAIYRRYFLDAPHEKALTSKYYYELKKYENY